MFRKFLFKCIKRAIFFAAAFEHYPKPLSYEVYNTELHIFLQGIYKDASFQISATASAGLTDSPSTTSRLSSESTFLRIGTDGTATGISHRPKVRHSPHPRPRPRLRASTIQLLHRPNTSRSLVRNIRSHSTAFGIQ